MTWVESVEADAMNATLPTNGIGVPRASRPSSRYSFTPSNSGPDAATGAAPGALAGALPGALEGAGAGFGAAVLPPHAARRRRSASGAIVPDRNSSRRIITPVCVKQLSMYTSLHSHEPFRSPFRSLASPDRDR